MSHRDVRVRIKENPRGSGNYEITMLGSYLGGATVAFGHLTDSGHFRYEWDHGLPYDFPDAEVSRAIDEAIADGEKYSTMFGDSFTTPRTR